MCGVGSGTNHGQCSRVRSRAAGEPRSGACKTRQQRARNSVNQKKCATQAQTRGGSASMGEGNAQRNAVRQTNRSVRTSVGNVCVNAGKAACACGSAQFKMGRLREPNQRKRSKRPACGGARARCGACVCAAIDCSGVNKRQLYTSVTTRPPQHHNVT